MTGLGWFMPFILVLLMSSSAWAQTPSRPPQACCSNFRVYAGSLLTELKNICKNSSVTQEEIDGIVEQFIKSTGSRLATNVAQECPNIDPHLKVRGIDHALHGCYDPRYLLELYVKYFNQGRGLCVKPGTTPQPPVVTSPCPPNDPQNGCGGTNIIVWPILYQPTGEPGPTANYNSFVYNIEVKLGEDDRSEKPISPQAPEPLQPQVPTDTVFGTQVGLLQPSETRMTSVQVPIVVTQNGTYGTAGVAFSPYKIYQLESDNAANISPLKRTPLLGRFLERIGVSLGATRNPGQMDQSPSTDGAVALSFQHLNDHDPLLNVDLANCLQGKAKEVKQAIIEACKDDKQKEACQLKEAEERQGVVRQAFRTCLSRFAKNAAATVLGASSELARFWYTYEGSLDWYLSWLAYGGMQYDFHQDVYVPAEAGAQVSLSTPSFSGHLDYSMMLGDVDGRIRLRPTGGLGVSVPTFGGMSANFGVRFMPLPWEETWSWHRAMGLMEKRYIVGIGWAGNDSASQFYRQYLQSKSP